MVCCWSVLVQLILLLDILSCVCVNMAENEAMIKLGRAFAALGAKPEYTAQEIEQWLVNQSGVKTEQDVPVPKDTSMLHLNPPRLPVFSGEGQKGDVSFTHWKYEVQCLEKDKSYKPASILQAIRRSLKGTASEVLLHLGEEVGLGSVLAKFDVVFGEVLGSEQIMQQFYLAKQESGENIASWGCRIEDILNRALKVGAVTKPSLQTMLCEKFWSGLFNSGLKSALRHHHDADMEYDQLFRNARSIESEFVSPKVKCQQLSQPENHSDRKLDEILSEVKKLGDRVSTLESKDQSKVKSVDSTRQPRRCYRCKSENHMIRDCPLRKENSNVPTERGSV